MVEAIPRSPTCSSKYRAWSAPAGSSALTSVGTTASPPPQDLPRIIRTERLRLVLLDLLLADVDGIELMRQVPELTDLPVIFTSG